MYNKNNDIKRIFHEESISKKRTARGVYSRASRLGYIRGGIKFPSDYLSKREINKLSGKVLSYNMYEKYKNLQGVKLEEILSKSDNEIKGILTYIKVNNTCTKICECFGISNGKLYSYYEKYGVKVEKKKPKNITKLSEYEDKLVPVVKFKLMDAISKGEYINRIVTEYGADKVSIAKFYKVSVSSINNYISKAKRKEEKKIEVSNIEKVDINNNSYESVNVDEIVGNNEEIKNNEISNNAKYINDIINLKVINARLEEELSKAKKDKITDVSTFKITLNGCYSKEELSSRLLALDSVMLDKKLYAINLTLNEVVEPNTLDLISHDDNILEHKEVV